MFIQPFNMGLSNHYVETACKLILRHNFKGVFPYDLFPLSIYKNTPYSFVVNLDKSTEPGSHFICMYITENIIEYYDSYGLAPFLPRIEKYIEKNINAGKHFNYNKMSVQPLTSDYCGYYVMGYLLSKDINCSLDDFNDIFSLKTLLNDKIIEEFITNVINVTY